MTALATRDRQFGLLDAAAVYLIGHPRASLAEVAAAAGVGRTTLFKRYRTREELEHAVAMRAVAVCVEAAGTTDRRAADGGLHTLVTALVPVGPQLSFIWRTPSLDADTELGVAYPDLDAAVHATLRRAQAAGLLSGTSPSWWLCRTLVALVYVAWECVESGRLARLDAPDQVVGTMVSGVGA